MSRIAVAAIVAASASSFAVNLGTRGAWAFPALALLSLFWRAGRLSPRVARFSKRALQIALVLMGLLGWILVIYPVLSTPTLRLWSLVLGYTFGVLGSFFLLAEGPAPREGAIPAAIGLLVVSAFDLEAGIHLYLVAAGGTAFLYLASLVMAARTPRRWARATLLAGFALPCAATAAGIILVLPWAQGKIEELMLAAYSPDMEGGEEGHRRLGDLRSLKLSRKVVMRVYSERPQKLRSGVLVRFDGVSWHKDPGILRMLSPASGVNLAESERSFLSSIPGSDFVSDLTGLDGQRLIRTSVVRVDGGGLVTPGGWRLVHAPLDVLQIDRAGVLSAPFRSSVRWYAVLHELDHRRSQEGPLEEADRASSLQLPEGLDPRIPELAVELVKGESDAERGVERIVGHLREQYHYSLDIGEVDERNPLADFLFRKKEGWCEYFATAAVVLLRTQGVPARYVAGFNVIGSQKKKDHYVVRDLDRHAWIEAYIEGRGWVEYDPTPAAEYESLHAGLGDGFWTDGVEWLKAHLASLRVQVGPSVLGASALGLALSVSGLAWIVRRRRGAARKVIARPSAKPLPTGLEELIEKLDRRAAELGYPRPKATAPLEHWKSVPADRLGPGRQAGIEVLESFYRARFGGVLVSREEVRRLRGALEGLRPGHS